MPTSTEQWVDVPVWYSFVKLFKKFLAHLLKGDFYFAQSFILDCLDLRFIFVRNLHIYTMFNNGYIVHFVVIVYITITYLTFLDSKLEKYVTVLVNFDNLIIF